MNHSARRPLSNEKGSSILNVLCVLAFTGSVLAALQSLVQMRVFEKNISRIAHARDQLVLQLRRETRASLNLYASIKPGRQSINDQLYKCLVNDQYATPPDATNDCVTGAKFYPTLYKNVDTSFNSPSLDDYIMAGPSEDKAAVYREDGQICNPMPPDNDVCMFKVWVEAQAICRDGWPTCWIANYIQLSVWVKTIYEQNGRTGNVMGFVQHVPVQDWSTGQWAVSGYDSFEVFPPPPPPSDNSNAGGNSGNAGNSDPGSSTNTDGSTTTGNGTVAGGQVTDPGVAGTDTPGDTTTTPGDSSAAPASSAGNNGQDGNSNNGNNSSADSGPPQAPSTIGAIQCPSGQIVSHGTCVPFQM